MMYFLCKKFMLFVHNISEVHVLNGSWQGKKLIFQQVCGIVFTLPMSII